MNEFNEDEIIITNVVFPEKLKGKYVEATFYHIFNTLKEKHEEIFSDGLNLYIRNNNSLSCKNIDSVFILKENYNYILQINSNITNEQLSENNYDTYEKFLCQVKIFFKEAMEVEIIETNKNFHEFYIKINFMENEIKARDVKFYAQKLRELVEYKYYLTKNHSLSIEVPKVIKTAVKQYLMFFSDYISNVKNEEVLMSISDTNSGITIGFESSCNDYLLEKYLEEYLLFTRTKNSYDFRIDFHDSNTNLQSSFTKELENQIKNLKRSVDEKNSEINYLRKTITNFQEILLSQSGAENSKKISESEKDLFSLKASLNELKILISDKENKFFDEIESIKNVAELKNNKNILSKLRKSITNFNDNFSTNEKAYKNIKTIIKIYNRLAEIINIAKIGDFF